MIAEYINKIVENNDKVLSVFLTCGYPDKEKFLEAAKTVLDNGADMLEIGIPFSDPLADGPVIQSSSQAALDKGIKMKDVFELTAKLRDYTDKPLVLMGYANPVVSYGIKKFFEKAASVGANGVIIPDIPADEYDTFFPDERNGIDTVLLATPFTSSDRLRKIDDRSSGFVYCVSVAGTTGARNGFDDNTLERIAGVKKGISKNKMLIGFGISGPASIKQLYDYSEGFIVGSAVVRSISEEAESGTGFEKTGDLVKSMKEACKRSYSGEVL